MKTTKKMLEELLAIRSTLYKMANELASRPRMSGTPMPGNDSYAAMNLHEACNRILSARELMGAINDAPVAAPPKDSKC